MRPTSLLSLIHISKPKAQIILGVLSSILAMQMQMAGHAVDVDGGQLGLDEGAGIVMECFGHMHAVRADPVIRHEMCIRDRLYPRHL